MSDLTGLQLQIDRLTAAEAVRDLIYEYTNLLDSGRMEAMAALFEHCDFGQADASGKSSNDTVRGAAAVLAQYRAFTRIHADTGTPRTKHVTTNVRVQVAPDARTATSTSYVLVVQGAPALPLQVVLTSRNFDRFERVDGTWRFSERLITIDHTGDLSAHALRAL
jgi:3-phenylpropionate/cinnamic acid dioxygenase small subunit